MILTDNCFDLEQQIQTLRNTIIKTYVPTIPHKDLTYLAKDSTGTSA